MLLVVAEAVLVLALSIVGALTTLYPISDEHPKRKRIALVFFVCCGVIGAALTGWKGYQANVVEDGRTKQLTKIDQQTREKPVINVLPAPVQIVQAPASPPSPKNQAPAKAPSPGNRDLVKALLALHDSTTGLLNLAKTAPLEELKRECAKWGQAVIDTLIAHDQEARARYFNSNSLPDGFPSRVVAPTNVPPANLVDYMWIATRQFKLEQIMREVSN